MDLMGDDIMSILYIDETKPKEEIAPEIYGHFSEHLGRGIYQGIFVGEDSEIPNEKGIRKDVAEALKKLHVPVLRWPGGCFADEYHWKDGIGSAVQRKKMLNTSWGGVTEDNSFGTHEYFELCRQLGCKTYVNGNVGSGTVREMSEWIEYMTFGGESPMADLRRKNGQDQPWKLDYFGVGNENWGCGGNMTARYYAWLYRRYQTYIRNYDSEHPIFKICGGANADDYAWTDIVLKECFESPAPPEAHGFMDGLSVHYYAGVEKGIHKGSATDFGEEQWFDTMATIMKLDELIRRHSEIMDRYDPQKKIGMMVDEWGCWHDVQEGTHPGFLYQQNTMRDALAAGIALNIFNRHCDRVRMACIAQMVNVLQALILTEGPKMILTPTYHVFDMYQGHQGARLLKSRIEGIGKVGTERFSVPEFIESASVNSQGKILITVCHPELKEEKEIEIVFVEKIPSNVQTTLLCGHMQDHNSFEEPERVKTKKSTQWRVEKNRIKVKIPPCCVAMIEVE